MAMTQSKRNSITIKATQIYRILKPLNLTNDCRIFCNQFEMMRDCVSALTLVEGWALTVLTQEVDKLLFDLETMIFTNYAVRQYKHRYVGGEAE